MEQDAIILAVLASQKGWGGGENMKFKSKVVEIEAMQFTNEEKDRVFNWITCGKEPSFDCHEDPKQDTPTLKIHTLEGWMTARLGDWIIKGLKGEFYPCKPDIFAMKYERIEESQ